MSGWRWSNRLLSMLIIDCLCIFLSVLNLLINCLSNSVKTINEIIEPWVDLKDWVDISLHMPHRELGYNQCKKVGYWLRWFHWFWGCYSTLLGIFCKDTRLWRSWRWRRDSRGRFRRWLQWWVLWCHSSNSSSLSWRKDNSLVYCSNHRSRRYHSNWSCIPYFSGYW